MNIGIIGGSFEHRRIATLAAAILATERKLMVVVIESTPMPEIVKPELKALNISKLAQRACTQADEPPKNHQPFYMGLRKYQTRRQ